MQCVNHPLHESDINAAELQGQIELRIAISVTHASSQNDEVQDSLWSATAIDQCRHSFPKQDLHRHRELEHS